MFNPIETFGVPLQRNSAHYHYKIKSISENTITYVGPNNLVKTHELTPSVDGVTIEDEYSRFIDNLFVAIAINGTYFMYSKLSNEYNW